MGNCSYVNEEKSGASRGWYCDRVGDFVDSSLYRNYCNGEVSCQYCPHLGGDDRYRREPEKPSSSSYEEPEEEVTTSHSRWGEEDEEEDARAESSSSWTPHGGSSSSSSSSGGGGASWTAHLPDWREVLGVIGFIVMVGICLRALYLAGLVPLVQQFGLVKVILVLFAPYLVAYVGGFVAVRHFVDVHNPLAVALLTILAANVLLFGISIPVGLIDLLAHQSVVMPILAIFDVQSSGNFFAQLFSYFLSYGMGELLVVIMAVGGFLIFKLIMFLVNL